MTPYFPTWPLFVLTVKVWLPELEQCRLSFLQKVLTEEKKSLEFDQVKLSNVFYENKLLEIETYRKTIKIKNLSLFKIHHIYISK